MKQMSTWPPAWVGPVHTAFVCAPQKVVNTDKALSSARGAGHSGGQRTWHTVPPPMDATSSATKKQLYYHTED